MQLLAFTSAVTEMLDTISVIVSRQNAPYRPSGSSFYNVNKRPAQPKATVRAEYLDWLYRFIVGYGSIHGK